MKAVTPKSLDLDFTTAEWPRAKDVLFREDTDWSHNAFLNLGGKGWESYANGYKRAADILAQQFLEDYRGLDCITYPVAFLYRHYIELRLKQLVVAGQRLLDKPVEFGDIHDLVVLWVPCREILCESWPKEPAGTWMNVERLIKEFNKLDPESMSFRYPVTKKNKKNLAKSREATLQTLNRVGMRNLYEVMQRLGAFFDCHISGVDVYLTEKSNS